VTEAPANNILSTELRTEHAQRETLREWWSRANFGVGLMGNDNKRGGSGPYPRHRGDPYLADLRRQILGLLGLDATW
jgi:hypothetical protein